MTALPDFARFWMVCRKPAGPGARTEPRKRYSTHDDARAAATKLAAENGVPFLILETVGVVWPRDAKQESLL